MKPAKAILLVVLALLMLGGVLLWAPWQPPEPLYRGKRLTTWLVDGSYWLSADDPRAPQKIAETQEAVRHMGEDAVPFLLGMLRQEDSRVRSRVAGWLEKGAQKYLAPLHAYELRSQAVWAFAVLGPGGRSAVPELEAMLLATNRASPFSNAVDVALALAGIGPESLGALLKGLTNQNRSICFAALQGIAHLGSRHLRSNPVTQEQRVRGALAARAVPLMARWIEEDDPLRGPAATVLGQLGLRPDLCIPALTRLYHRLPSNLILRRIAVGALEEFGADAREAAPLFLSALNDPDAMIRHTARRALEILESGVDEGSQHQGLDNP